jgi:hypothetical protein
VEWSKPARRLTALCGFAIGVALAVGACLSDGALLDWDTYQRIQFIAQYDSSGVDTHVLYHALLLGLIKWGLSPVNGVFALTSASVGLLAATAWWVADARGLRGRARALVVGLLLLASPGFVALTLMAEDNVSYLPPLLCFLHLVSADPVDVYRERARGLLAGSALAIAMLLNVTALVFLVIGPLAIVAWALKRRPEANRLVATCLSFALVYYGFYALSGWGAGPALHKYIWQAAALQDFGDNPIPILSWKRLEHFAYGARAMFLAPTAYRMDLTHWFSDALLVYAPLLLLSLQGALTWWMVRQHAEHTQQNRGWRLIPVAIVGVTLAFPYLYESLLIERWDMFWLCHFLWLIRLFRTRPRMGVEVLACAFITIQLIGTGLVLRHHFGDQFAQQSELELRTTIEQIQNEDRALALFPANMNRQHIAHIAHHMPHGSIYLLADTGADSVECHRVSRILVESQVSCKRLGARLHHLGGAFIHVDVGSSVVNYLASESAKQ